MSWRWRGGLILALHAALSACATIPQTAEQGVTDIKGITGAIECELAAVAMEPRFRDRELAKWKSLTDVDLTLQNNLGASASGWIAFPVPPAFLALNPSISANRKVTNTSHVQFVTPIGVAKAQYGATCSGPDPSETNMGLAEWLRATLIAIDKRAITGLTFTKELDISASAGSRFGYVVTAAVNATDKGGALSSDKISRITIALAPPPPGMPPPMAVFVVDEPEIMKKQRLEALEKAAKHDHTANRAAHDQTLQNLLQRKAPVKLAP